MTDINPQAGQLNEQIMKERSSVMDLLSEKGKAIYFPKLGILSQSAEAKGKDINATIGIALEEDGGPMNLSCISRRVDLPAAHVFPYAPSHGRPDLREAWKAMLIKKNPSISGKCFSLPIVTSALTHGLSTCGYMFCNPGDRIIIPDLFWGNYNLIFAQAHEAIFDKFPLFNSKGGFNISGFRKKLLSGAAGKRIVCLNFPNNPTGYTPTVEEMQDLKSALLEAAQQERKIVVLIDDAYFGLVYERGVYDQSVFGELCDLHANILAVKLDGATKEDYAWGFRVGFITYGIQGGTQLLYEALEAKTAGAVRGNVSNSSNVCQSLLVEAYSSGEYEQEKKDKYEVLRRRYETVKGILAAHPEYEEHFVPLPFNSGYFMCVKMLKVDSEKLRRKLLDDYSTGVIAISGAIRVAFSSTPTHRLENLFDNIFQAAKALS
ncbi:aminotransferase class I/II-fold pyridoxal phosphate-dependent enzyme [Verrucomicrobiota bacterium]